MCNKRYINIHIERIVLLLKAQKLFALIPIIFINIIIPIISLTIYVKKGVGDELDSNINQILPLFIPFFSCWWVIFSLKFFYEDKGSEILYICSDKTKILDLSLLFLLMLLDIILSVIPYFFIIEGFIFIFLNLILICIFYFGLSFCITAVSKSITPTLLILIIYILLNTVSPFNETIFPFYYSPDISTNIFFCEIPLALSGCILIVIAIYVIRYRKNNL